jgi:hypothetical protein
VVDEGPHVQPVGHLQPLLRERRRDRVGVADVALGEQGRDTGVVEHPPGLVQGALVVVQPDHEDRVLVRVPPAERVLGDEGVQVDEPAAVAAAHVGDEARLARQRLAIEDLLEDGVGVGEVPLVGGRAGDDVQPSVHVPLRLAGLRGHDRPAHEEVG